jgi:hypothetical protein
VHTGQVEPYIAYSRFTGAKQVIGKNDRQPLADDAATDWGLKFVRAHEAFEPGICPLPTLSQVWERAFWLVIRMRRLLSLSDRFQIVCIVFFISRIVSLCSLHKD